jgi:hypothetical protein
VNGKSVRRDVADLILEALDIARSRKLATPETAALILDVLHVERPDIHPSHAARLIARYRARYSGGD